MTAVVDAAATVLAGIAIVFVGLGLAAKLGGVMPEELVRLLVGGTDKEQP